MAQITLTFPDGNARDVPAGITAAQVAKDISKSLAKKAISATVNGAHWDLQWTIEADAQIAIHTMQDAPQALELIRHDLAALWAAPVLHQAWRHRRLWPARRWARVLGLAAAPLAGWTAFALFYYGLNQPSFQKLVLPEDGTWQVDIIDTWEMTITPMEGAFSGKCRVDLPAKPYIALRIRKL